MYLGLSTKTQTWETLYILHILHILHIATLQSNLFKYLNYSKIHNTLQWFWAGSKKINPAVVSKIKNALKNLNQGSLFIYRLLWASLYTKSPKLKTGYHPKTQYRKLNFTMGYGSFIFSLYFLLLDVNLYKCIHPKKRKSGVLFLNFF